MSSTRTTIERAYKIADAAVRERKVSVPISMPQRLLTEIDTRRGDTPRSVFVCKILSTQISKPVEGNRES